MAGPAAVHLKPDRQQAVGLPELTSGMLSSLPSSIISNDTPLYMTKEMFLGL